jgi:hypothetical protein
MPELDPQVMSALGLASSGKQADKPALDTEISDALGRAGESQKARQNYLRDKYAYGLAATLKGERSTYSGKVMEEVTDPAERQWLVNEVAQIAAKKDWAERKSFQKSGYLKQRQKIAEKVGGAFADASTSAVEAFGDLKDWTMGKGRSPEDIKFLRALESAKMSENASVGSQDPLTLKAITGAAGMAPDMAAGLLSASAGGPAGMATYWTARGINERREDFREMGLGSTASAAAGLGTAGAEAAIELINIDPTGMTKPAAAPVKGFMRQGLKRVASKVAGEGVQRLIKNPVTKRVIGAGAGFVKRAALETLEEGLQGSTAEAAKYLASKMSDKAEDRDPIDILREGYQQAKAAAPGIAVIGAPGGMVQAANAVGRYKKFVDGSKRAMTWTAIEQAAAEDRTPSRKEWQAWGLPAEEGKTAKQRRETVKGLAKAISATRQAEESAQAAAEPQQMQPMPVEPERPATQQADVELADGGDAAILPQTRQVAAMSRPAIEEPAAEARAAEGELADGRPVPRMKMEAEGTGEELGGREVVREVEKIWGAPVRSGRVRQRGALGIYKTHPQVMRMARGGEANVSTAAHEAAHHLDQTTDILKSAPADLRKEVAQLDYDQGKKRDFEGFAEFSRGYMTESTDIQQMAPKFFEHFESYLKANPEIARKVEATKALVKRLKTAGAVGRVKGQISKTGKDENESATWKEFSRNAWNYLYTKMKDQGDPVKRFAKEAVSRGHKGITAYEMYNAMRQTGSHFAARALEDGVFALSGDQKKIGPSLREVFVEIKDDADYRDFVAWAYAHHAIESWDAGKNPGISREDAAETERRLRDTRYEKAADTLTEFNNSLITMLADAGVISGEDAGRMLKAYEHYIPLQRAKDSIFKGKGGKKMVDLGRAVKGRRGSGLQIVDPVEATLKRAVKLYDRACKQLVVNSIVKTSDDVAGMGEWVERVPPAVAATSFKLEEIRRQLSKNMPAGLGVELEQMLDVVDPETVLTVFQPDLMQTGGQPIFRVTVDGKQQLVQLKPELAEAIGGIGSQVDLDIATHIVKRFTGAVKLGATRLNPSFILTNSARDYQTFLMQGEKGLKGAVDPVAYAMSYAASELKRANGEDGDPLVRLWQRMGGELSTYAGLDRNQLKSGVKRLRRGKQGKVETALNIAGTSEVASRLAEFSAILEKQGWLEKVKAGQTPPMEVLIKAINASHDVTVDFRRTGTWGRKLNYWIPFINAQLEGLDKTVRTFKAKPAETFLRVAIMQLPIAMLYWWYRHDDDDYKERPEWQDGYWVLADDKGNPSVRIPRPHEYGLIGSGVERMLDAMYEKDPQAITRWFRQAGKTAMPNTTPALVTPLAESFFNFDTFRGRPIVSRSIEKLQEPDQYYEHTSSIAKSAARHLHDLSGGKVSLSPAKIDHLANGLSGGLYRRVDEPAEKMLRGGKWKASDIPGLKGIMLRQDYSKSSDDFYAAKEELDRAHESAKLRNKDYEGTKEWRKYQYAGQLMTEIRNAARQLPADERERVSLAMTGLARAALGKEPLKRYSSPFSGKADLPQVVQAVVDKHVSQKAATAAREKSGSTVDDTVFYLKQMSVSGDVARKAMYSRLRSQGIKVESAKKRQRQLARRLK